MLFWRWRRLSRYHQHLSSISTGRRTTNECSAGKSRRYYTTVAHSNCSRPTEFCEASWNHDCHFTRARTKTLSTPLPRLCPSPLKVHTGNVHAVGQHFCAYTVLAAGESVVDLGRLDVQQNLSWQK